MKKFALVFLPLILAGCVALPSPNDNLNVSAPNQNKNQTVPVENKNRNQEPAKNTTGLPLALPAGFSMSVFAADLGNPRVMQWGPRGLMASIPEQGKIVSLPDGNNDGQADEVVTELAGLNRPHGFFIRTSGSVSSLYVAETDQLSMYTYDEETQKFGNKQFLVALPGGGRHFSRSLLTLPTPYQDLIYISVGSSCDVCNETDNRRAKILTWDGSKLETFASGLRNAVFMAFHPATGKIWATEMGRDNVGDNIPPDEVNIIEKGKNYGWPVCYGKNVHDSNFDTNNIACKEPDMMPSHIDLQAHSAPLGLAFFPADGWSREYAGDLLVAYHGSWNRSEKTGYKIVRFQLDAQGQPTEKDGQAEDFITGWLDKNGKVWGRPADVFFAPSGGALYISDDENGNIYQLQFQGV